MSLEALLSNDTITVERPAHLKDRSGGAINEPWQTVYSNVPARVEDMSARQIELWAMAGTLVTTTVYTQQTGIGKPMRITTSDGRHLRVEGVKFNRAIGGMPDFYEVICEEVRPGS